MSWSSLLIPCRLAFRARYAWLVIGCVVALLMAASLSALFSGRQPSTVALDVGISVMRLSLPLLLILLMQELVSREFDRRYFLSSLSYPVSRLSFLLERFFAVVGMVLVAQFVMAMSLAILVILVGKGYAQSSPVNLGLPYVVTMVFMSLDLLVLCAVALLLAVVASTPSFVLVGTFGFMLIARSYSAIIELLLRETYVVDNPEGYRASLGMLGYLLPDLGRLDVRMVALYGYWDFIPGDWFVLLVSSLIYICALLCLSVWLLERKLFS